jgi:hypothetical protein
MLEVVRREFQTFLGDPYNVIGITKPNANLLAITSSFNLKRVNDVVVICGGTVDVGRNETNTGLWHLTHFDKRTNNSSSIILDVLHCFGMEDTLCVNKQVAF